jgi:hypothetical protein
LSYGAAATAFVLVLEIRILWGTKDEYEYEDEDEVCTL